MFPKQIVTWLRPKSVGFGGKFSSHWNYLFRPAKPRTFSAHSVNSNINYNFQSFLSTITNELKALKTAQIMGQIKVLLGTTRWRNRFKSPDKRFKVPVSNGHMKVKQLERCDFCTIEREWRNISISWRIEAWDIFELCFTVKRLSRFKVSVLHYKTIDN